MLTRAVSKSVFQSLQITAPQVRCRWVNNVKYPFSSSTDMHDLNRPCRYTKLRAWSLVDYDRVIMIDSDALVLEPIDHLFNLPANKLYAVSDAYPRIFNSGFVILRPSFQTLASMIESVRHISSYNKGDQGFLNSFFFEHDHQTEPADREAANGLVGQPYVPLDAKYNFPTWLANTYYGKSKFPNFPAGVGILHFSGEVKPWRLVGDRKAFDRFYEPRAYHLWRRIADEAEVVLACNRVSRGSHCAPESNNNKTQGRHEACDENVELYASRRFDHLQDFVTVLLSTFDGSRLSIDELVRHYTNSSVVARVVIVWHNPNLEPKVRHRRVVNGKQVSTVWQKHDSLNNRFMPFDATTKNVLICDDDVIVSLDDLRFAYGVSREHPDRLVSPFVRASRLHSDKSSSSGYFERDKSFAITGARHYSIALTKFCFAPTWLLFIYSCLLNPDVYLYVDRVNNCEDVAFNILAAAVGLRAPLMVDIMVSDFGRTSGLSSQHGHQRERSSCVKDLGRLITGTQISSNKLLKHASTASGPFISTRVQYRALREGPFNYTNIDNSLMRGMILQQDPAICISIVERCWIDSINPENFTSDFGVRSHARGVHSRTTVAYKGSHHGHSTTPTAHKLTSGLKTLKDLDRRKVDLRDVILLIKLHRRDLEKADVKDESRGVLLLDLVLTRHHTFGMEKCPLRAFYLPNFPENWTASALACAFDFDYIGKFSIGFAVELVSVQSLYFVNLKAIDAAYVRDAKTGSRATNITLALTVDNRVENVTSCSLSWHKPVSCIPHGSRQHQLIRHHTSP